MSPLAALISFAAAAALLTMTPGLDTALVLRTAAAEGRRNAIMAALGIQTGVLTWGVIVALGLGAVLAASEQAYNILRLCGAGYLCWLGIGMLRRPREAFDLAQQHPARPGSLRQSWFVRGCLTNLLNPKVGVFYVTFLPQFVPESVNVPLFTVLLALVHMVEGAIWFALIISATHSLGSAIRKPAVIRALDRLTGAVLIAFGIRLLFAARK